MSESSTKILLSKFSKRIKGIKDDVGIVSLPQDSETTLRTITNTEITYRFAYARAKDCQVFGDNGQDYLTLNYHSDALIFALCDGVSQSYYGEIAARYLGDTLCDCLAHRIPAGYDPEMIRTALTAALQEAVPAAKELVDSHKIPVDIPEMLRSVLAEKKKIGSESTFVCGRIDLSGKNYPAGRVILAWLGDSRLRIWDSTQEVTDRLKGEFDTRQRWSSRQGTIGSHVHVYAAKLGGSEGVRRLLAYTDGLNSLDQLTKLSPDHKIQDLVNQAGNLPTSDDIAFLEILLEPWKTELADLV